MAKKQTQKDTAPADTTAENQTQQDNDATEAEIEGIFVRSAIPGKSFCRAGFEFTNDGTGIELAALTDKQIAALENEKMLVCERCTFKPGDNFIDA